MTQNKPQGQPNTFLKQGNGMFLVTWPQLRGANISFTEDGTEGKKTHQLKVAAALGSIFKLIAKVLHSSILKNLLICIYINSVLQVEISTGTYSLI